MSRNPFDPMELNTGAEFGSGGAELADVAGALEGYAQDVAGAGASLPPTFTEGVLSAIGDVAGAGAGVGAAAGSGAAAGGGAGGAGAGAAGAGAAGAGAAGAGAAGSGGILAPIAAVWAAAKAAPLIALLVATVAGGGAVAIGEAIGIVDLFPADRAPLPSPVLPSEPLTPGPTLMPTKSAVESVTPTPTASPVPTSTPWLTPSPTPIPTPSASACPSPSPGTAIWGSPSPSPSPSPWPLGSASAEPSPGFSPSVSACPSASPSTSPSPTPSPTPSPSGTLAAEGSVAATPAGVGVGPLPSLTAPPQPAGE